MEIPIAQIKLLDQTTKWFRAAFDYSDVGFAIVSLEGKCLLVNNKLCEILGYSNPELVKLTFRDITHPDDLTIDESNFNGLLNNSIEHYKIEKRFYHSSGKVIFVHLTVSPVKDDNGKPVYFISQVIDQTLMKTSVDKVQISRKQLQKIMDQSLDIIINTSFDGIILQINKACKNIWGYDAKELIGRKVRELVIKEDYEKTRIVRELMAKGKTVKGFENRLRRKDGSIVTMSWHMRGNKSDKTIFSIARDTTEKKIAQEQLNLLNAQLKERAEELELSNKHLEEFAYIASHDLQEPLRMVSGFLELLQKKYKETLDDTALKYITFAVDGAYRMQKLIRGLLECSVAGNRDKLFENIDLNIIVSEAIKLNAFVINHSNAVIIIDKLPVIMGNYNGLLQLFQNLISNALKYRKPDIPPIINIAFVENDQNWEFALKDNGIGIERKYFDIIFKLFHRLHDKVTYTGSGIGLALCKRILESHNGKIWLDSSIGIGSTFYFTIKKKTEL